jgi:hypothetical protein
MATNPKVWAEGETPTKTELDKYKTALQEVEAVTGTVAVLMATPFQSSATFNLLRTRRYLHFRSNGVLADPAASEDDITLSENSDTGRGTLDLDTTWVAYGQQFVCTGVNAVWHDDEP